MRKILVLLISMMLLSFCACSNKDNRELEVQTVNSEYESIRELLTRPETTEAETMGNILTSDKTAGENETLDEVSTEENDSDNILIPALGEKETDAQDDSNTSTEYGTDTPKTVVIYSCPAQQPVVNYFHSDIYYTAVNDVVFSPKDAYYKDNQFIVEMYVYNGYSTAISNLSDIHLTITNGIYTLADGTFSSMDNCSIASNSYTTWTFYFSPEDVILQGGSLSYLDTYYSCNYTY